MLNWRDVKHPEAGGAEIHLQEIGSRWAKWGHDVSLYCAAFNNGSKFEELNGVQIQRVGNKYTIYVESIKKLLSSRNGERFDVIFESINTVPFFSPLVSKSPVVGQIYSIENRSVLLAEMKWGTFLPASFAYLVSSMIPAVYRNCEITTISESSKSALTREGFKSDRVSVAYPGLSEAWISTLKDQSEIERPNASIVYLGRLKKYKGIQDVLYAIPFIKKEIPRFKFRIVGKGDFEESLRGIVDSLNIGEDVEFLGFLSEEEKAQVLKSSSAYVCTSRDEGGWTIAAIEAMSVGLPVLVTRSQIDVLANGTNGWLLENHDPITISRNVVSLLKDRNTWTKLSKNAITFSQKFNWDETAQVTFRALERAVSTQTSYKSRKSVGNY